MPMVQKRMDFARREDGSCCLSQQEMAQKLGSEKEGTRPVGKETA